jgi:hypothetical protein
MKSMPLHARLSFVRPAAAVLALIFGVTTLPAWAQSVPPPGAIAQLKAQVAALQQQITTLQSTVTNQTTQIAEGP